jgi:hypothetical protein
VAGTNAGLLFAGIRNLDFDVAAWFNRIEHRRNLVDVQPNTWPLWRAQYCQSDFTACQVLLIAHVLIGGQKQTKPGSLSFGEQVTVAQPVPPAVFRFCNGVASEIRSQRRPGYCDQTG